MKTETIGKVLLIVGLLIMAYVLATQPKVALPSTLVVQPNPTMNFGVLEISAQSMMPDAYQYVSFNIDKIEVLDSDNNWKEVVSNSMATELSYIQNAETVLGSVKMGAGEYSSMRVSISGVKYTTMDGRRGSLRILGDAPIEVPYSFEISDGKTSKVRLMLDAREAMKNGFFDLNIKI